MPFNEKVSLFQKRTMSPHRSARHTNDVGNTEDEDVRAYRVERSPDAQSVFLDNMESLKERAEEFADMLKEAITDVDLDEFDRLRDAAIITAVAVITVAVSLLLQLWEAEDEEEDLKQERRNVRRRERLTRMKARHKIRLNRIQRTQEKQKQKQLAGQERVSGEVTSDFSTSSPNS